VKIVNGTLNASGKTGIGTGGGEDSVIEKISVNGGKIFVRGILTGIGGNVKILKISGRTVLDCETRKGVPAINASAIAFSNADLVISSKNKPVFGVEPLNIGSFNLTVFQRIISTLADVKFSKLKGNFLQIGNLSLPKTKVPWTLCLSTTGYNKCIEVQPEATSLVVSVPFRANYRIRAFSGNLNTFLRDDDGLLQFGVGNHSFFRRAVTVSPVKNRSASIGKTRSPLQVGVTSTRTLTVATDNLKTAATRSATPSRQAGFVTLIVLVSIIGVIIVTLLVILGIALVRKYRRSKTTSSDDGIIEPIIMV
jgi:hypothetical protein